MSQKNAETKPGTDEYLLPADGEEPKPTQGREGISKAAGDGGLEAFLASIHFDKRMWKQDIRGSKAHVQMLMKQEILSKADGEAILAGLDDIKQEIEDGRFQFDISLEDIHMNIEHALVEKIGDIGGAVHTARSRNDQVALDLRLYVRDEIEVILELLTEFQSTIKGLAEEHGSGCGDSSGTIIPGYTHLQQAQPVLLSEHLMAHYYKLQRDKERFTDCLKRVNVNPLGACALAGTTHAIDKGHTTKLLGMDKPFENTLDAVSDRDFAVEAAFCCSLAMTHLSSICEEVVLWTTAEFGFAALGEGTYTGSSIMPQKKNPDIAELVRGKTGRVNGNLVALLTVLKGLPLAYNKDLQEDKESLFDSLDTLKGSLNAMNILLSKMEFTIDQEAMVDGMEKSFANATELADHLVKQGMPFRTAYNITKQVVAYCQEQNKVLNDLSLEELGRFSVTGGEELHSSLDIKSSAKKKSNTI